MSGCLTLLGCAGSPAPAPSPTPPSVTTPPATTAARLARTRATVAGLVQAVQQRDRSGWNRLVSSRDPQFPARADTLYANLEALPLTSFGLRLDPAQVAVSTLRQRVVGADAWVQAVRVTWRLSEDNGPADQTLWLTFVDDDGVRVAGTGDEPSGQPPAQQPSWSLGPVTVVRTGSATVVAGPGQSASAWATRADRATRQVARLLPAPLGRAWNGTVVVEVPAEESGFEAVLGVAAGSRSGIAAVAQQEGSTDAAAIRVVVNPRAGDLLDAAQLSRVLRHEIVHVATRAADSPAPTWATEGLAEWVSLRGHPSQQSFGTDDLLARVRAGEVPDSLPDDPAFAASATDLNGAYAQAWLVFRFLASTTSVSAVGAFSAQLDDGRSVDAAARSALGLSQAQLTTGWRRYLVRLAERG